MDLREIFNRESFVGAAPRVRMPALSCNISSPVSSIAYVDNVDSHRAVRSMVVKHTSPNPTRQPLHPTAMTLTPRTPLVATCLWKNMTVPPVRPEPQADGVLD